MPTTLLAAVAAAPLFAATSALAADAPPRMPLKTPAASPPVVWTGWYVGGHFGYGNGSFGPGTNPILAEGVFFPPTVTGLIGGFQGGYNLQLHNNVVLGAEADVTFPSPIDRPATGVSPFNTTFDYLGTVRARIGYAFGAFLPYVTGGLAIAQTQVNINDLEGEPVSATSKQHFGWVAGAGFEYALLPQWTAKIEYDYIDLGSRTYDAGETGASAIRVTPRVHLVKLGLNYQLREMPASASGRTPAPNRAATSDADNWSIHGQTTFILQGYGGFRSPYQGANSLPGGGQARETWTATAYIGRRLWEGGEIYFNPELAQGFGLADTRGLGGFSNGEAQKAGGEFPRIRPQRYFFRQTFGLGGEQETVEDGPNQLAGKRDIDRITVTVGRFAITDYFDANAYAHDPRADFMNWAIWASAAYDFPADLPGFTRGAVVEINRKDWALRGGVFQVPTEPSSDVLVFKTGGAALEYEQRYTLFDQPGKLRLGAFANRGRTGNYREALAIVAADPAININDAMASIRRQRPKNGVYANFEQAIDKDIGVFGRASWNDGRNEILSFTDIDRSVSGGVSIKGAKWGRPDDTFGLAGAVNGLSSGHRDFLAAGGLGLLIGDGALNYGTEKILEAYYAISLGKPVLTFDYQFIANPAYNKDRGPVSIFAGRVHAEF